MYLVSSWSDLAVFLRPTALPDPNPDLYSPIVGSDRVADCATILADRRCVCQVRDPYWREFCSYISLVGCQILYFSVTTCLLLFSITMMMRRKRRRKKGSNVNYEKLIIINICLRIQHPNKKKIFTVKMPKILLSFLLKKKGGLGKIILPT